MAHPFSVRICYAAFQPFTINHNEVIYHGRFKLRDHNGRLCVYQCSP